MIVTVKEFCYTVEHNDTISFVKTVFKEMGTTPEKKPKEFENTIASYKELSPIFSKAIEKNSKFGEVQICTINNISLIAEYLLPSSSARCDVVLLGKGKEKNQVLIIENKNFDFWGKTEPCGAEGLVLHNGYEQEHPADQVRGYVEYCKYFHSTVLKYDACVDGCVFFSQPLDLSPFKEKPNDTLCEEYPIFNTDTTEALADYILDRIEEEDNKFATDFEDGYYKQDRNILKQVAENLLNTDARPFVLLKKQREGYNKVMSKLEKCAKTIEEGQKKQVIVVEGPPGSGKSAVAINLWVDAVRKYTDKDNGNIVFVTTSKSQKENWFSIFKKYGKKHGADKLIITANNYSPIGPNSYASISSKICKLDKKYKSVEDDNSNNLKYEYYDEYTDFILRNNLSKSYKENLHFLSVVDEAHALLNPLDKDYEGGMYGWIPQIGPQAYHIIRESLISVFLMDCEQSFRQMETTSVKDIHTYADKLGADFILISLEDMQFRCAGSTEYVAWVDNLLTDTPLRNHDEWKDNFHVEVVDYPSEVEEYLRKKMNPNKKAYVRLMSSYSREWKSQGLTADHSKIIKKKNNKKKKGIEEEVKIDLSVEKNYDFELEDKDGKLFKKHWNNRDYAAHVQATDGSMMAKDPLCEVGCPYTIRGFDYDHIGLLWLEDFVWRTDHWEINFEYIKEKGLSGPAKLAREEQVEKRHMKKKEKDSLGEVRAFDDNFPLTKDLAKAMASAYRILLTRAMISYCIYIKDPETREHVRSLLK